MKNKDIHAKVCKIIKDNELNVNNKEHGLMVLTVFLDKKKKDADIKVMINGLKIKQAEDCIRTIYAHIYEKRVRKNPKMIALNDKLEAMRIKK